MHFTLGNYYIAEECGHGFCDSCADHHLDDEDNHFTCPVCRVVSARLLTLTGNTMGQESDDEEHDEEEEEPNESDEQFLATDHSSSPDQSSSEEEESLYSSEHMPVNKRCKCH